MPPAAVSYVQLMYAYVHFGRDNSFKRSRASVFRLFSLGFTQNRRSGFMCWLCATTSADLTF
jgi:hypothetical protein